jgi:signal transduction histidine kinase
MANKLFCSKLIRFIGIGFLLFFASKADAQVKTPQQKLDSILAVNLSHPKEDSIKLVIYRDLYRQYIRIKDPVKVSEYIDKSLVLAKKINEPWYAAEAYNRRARGYHGVANYQKAAEFYQKAVASYMLAKDEDNAAGMYLNMGALYYGIPDYAKSLEMSQNAMAIFQKNGNNIDLASVYANVGGLYQDLGQQANAINYLNKALKVFTDENIPRGVAVASNSIGALYLSASVEELAKMGIKPEQRHNLTLENLNKALKVGLEINDPTVLGSTYRNLGVANEQIGKRDIALQSYLKSISYSRLDGNKTDYSNVLLALANFYVQDKDYDKAVPLVNEALKIGNDDHTLDTQKSAYQLMSLIEEQKGNYNASLENYKKYITVRDLIFNEEKEREITRKQLQIDFAVKEKDYQLKQQVTDGELQRQVLLARQQQQQLELRQQELQLSAKEKSLQRLTFLKKQADLEEEKEDQTTLLKQQQLTSRLDKEIKDKQINFQKADLKFNKNVNLFLGVLVAILFASALFVFYSQRKTAKLNKLVSEQKLELEKLSRVKDRIFSVVSHDMRTPVNSLISFIQLLEGGNINTEKLNKYAANLKHTLGYTSAMMENLLNWASSQMQGFKPIIERFDINVCAQDVINSMEAVSSQKNIKIQNEIKSGIECLADMNMSSLVLRNLISNAIKFTPNNGAVMVNAEVKANQVLIHVIDNGVGLSAEQLNEFNQQGYHETGKSTLGTNKEKGTGIGLVLCKTFTSMMNGTLEAKSDNRNGTTFIFTLPKG